VRRLIQLELGEIHIPKPYRAPKHAPSPPYFRVTLSGEDLEVQLWHRGEFQGRRKLSSRGAQALVARRVALVAAELATRLVERRRRHAKRMRREQAKALRRSLARRGRPIFARWAMSSGARGANLGSDAWLFGGYLGAQLRFDSSARIEMAGSVMMGPTPGVPNAGPGEWLELSIAPGYQLHWTSRHSSYAALVAAAATQHITRSGSREPREPAVDEWNARAALRLGHAVRVGPSLELEVNGEVGSALRRINIPAASGDRRLGGLWLGLALAVNLDPLGP
jgi:hypothetical protein